MLNVNQIVQMLGLNPLPKEGGFYAETYRSSDIIPHAALPQGRYPVDKSLCTAIYYLLTPETKSLIHRLPSDEIFHFYLGDPVQMLQLSPNGEGRIIELGHDIVGGQTIQAMVPAGTWQGSRLLPGGEYALMGTTVAPGFDFSDYEAGRRGQLIQQFPQFREIIEELTE
jgi:predicted cupin superfamily sugar epimerase